MPGVRISTANIQCKVPLYTKPDVLNVEVTINDESYSNDNLTYGYFDPFVLDAKPKLIHVDGSTKLSIIGLGFVDSKGLLKAQYSKRKSPIVCGADLADCQVKASF